MEGERDVSHKKWHAQNPKGVQVALPRHETIKKKYLHARNVTYSFVYPSILHPGVSQCSPCCLIVYVEASLGNSLMKAMISSSPAANALEGERDVIAISSSFIVFLLSFKLLSVIKQKRVRALKESRLLRFFRSDDARVKSSSSPLSSSVCLNTINNNTKIFLQNPSHKKRQISSRCFLINLLSSSSSSASSSVAIDAIWNVP